MTSRLIRACFWIALLGAAPGATAQVVTAGPDSALVATTPAAAPAKSPGLSHPAKAALWGLIPGGGQIYNHDYWKVPIVYAVMGGLGYAIYWNNDRYVRFTRAYRLRNDADTLNADTDPLTMRYTNSGVDRGRSFYRRNRDLNIILSAAAYGLSIMEALVDAHLSTFTVSDDLSLRVAPTTVPLPGAPWPAPGLGLTLTVR